MVGIIPVPKLHKKRSHSNSIICIEAWANEINAIQRSNVSVFFKITYIVNKEIHTVGVEIMRPSP